MSTFLVTYAIHSTLFLGGAWLALAAWRSAKPELRETVWKFAMVAGILTAVVVHLFAGTDGVEERLTEEPVIQAVPFVASEVTSVTGAGPATTETGGVSFLDSAQHFFEGPLEVSPGLGNGLLMFWLCGAVVGLVGLLRGFLRLRTVLSQAHEIESDHKWQVILEEILERRGIRRPVTLLAGEGLGGPVACGLGPWRILVPEPLMERLDREQARAVLAHEVAHLRRGDTWWALAAEAFCAVFFFQPLHFLARRRIRMEAEFLADREAVQVLENRAGLARCLLTLGEWLARPGHAPRLAGSPATVGMASHRSLLGRRVAELVSREDVISRPSRGLRAACLAALLALTAAILGIAPRAELTAADETPKPEAIAKKEPAGSGIDGFRGLLQGRIVAKDVEAGRFTLEVKKILASFKNSQSKGDGLIGRQVVITGIAGEPLDLLISLKLGDEVEIEAVHDAGETLRGAPYEHFRRAQASSDPKTAEAGEAGKMEEGNGSGGVGGFRGVLRGKLLEKDVEAGRLTLEVTGIPNVFPKSQSRGGGLIGRQVAITGISGQPLDTLISLKPGEEIEIAAIHEGGENLIGIARERFRRVEAGDAVPGEKKMAAGQAEMKPAGGAKFGGILRGRILEKDVEAGRFNLEITGIHTVFRNSQSKGEHLIGRKVAITGISGEPLDRLITMKPGEEVEICAFDEGGDNLRAVAREHFRRVEKGDAKKMEAAGEAEMNGGAMAPGMVGFRGILSGELLEKDIEAGTLSVKVVSVPRVWEKNKANPEALIGRTIPVRGIAGKWLDVLIGLNKGDRIEVEAFQNEGPVFDFVQEWLKKAD